MACVRSSLGEDDETGEVRIKDFGFIIEPSHTFGLQSWFWKSKTVNIQQEFLLNLIKFDDIKNYSMFFNTIHFYV